MALVSAAQGESRVISKLFCV